MAIFYQVRQNHFPVCIVRFFSLLTCNAEEEKNGSVVKSCQKYEIQKPVRCKLNIGEKKILSSGEEDEGGGWGGERKLHKEISCAQPPRKQLSYLADCKIELRMSE